MIKNAIFLISYDWIYQNDKWKRVTLSELCLHDDVIKWRHFPRYWPFVLGFHWSPVNSPNRGQWRGALMFSLICSWINGWVNIGETDDLRRHHAHYDVTVMQIRDSLCHYRLYMGRNNYEHADDEKQIFLMWVLQVNRNVAGRLRWFETLQWLCQHVPASLAIRLEQFSFIWYLLCFMAPNLCSKIFYYNFDICNSNQDPIFLHMEICFTRQWGVIEYNETFRLRLMSKT